MTTWGTTTDEAGDVIMTGVNYADATIKIPIKSRDINGTTYVTFSETLGLVEVRRELKLMSQNCMRR